MSLRPAAEAVREDARESVRGVLIPSGSLRSDALGLRPGRSISTSHPMRSVSLHEARFTPPRATSARARARDDLDIDALVRAEIRARGSEEDPTGVPRFFKGLASKGGAAMEAGKAKAKAAMESGATKAASTRNQTMDAATGMNLFDFEVFGKPYSITTNSIITKKSTTTIDYPGGELTDGIEYEHISSGSGSGLSAVGRSTYPVVGHRFYNGRWRHLYRSCPLPVTGPEFEQEGRPNRIWNGRQDTTFDNSSGFWNRTTRSPDGLAHGPCFEYSMPFAPPEAASSSNADPEPSEGASSSDADPEPPKKKQKGKRKRVRIGAFRTYSVRMMPTVAQRRELMRCFGAARYAYNYFVDQVEEHDERSNEYELKKAYRASGETPAWATCVASKIAAGGITDAANAYKSNFAMQAKDPSHHFEIKYRSHKKNLTEVIHIEGDGEGTKQSPLLAFKPLPFRNSSTKRAECAVFFGNNLSGIGDEEDRPEESTADRAMRLSLNAQLRSLNEERRKRNEELPESNVKMIPKPKAGPWRDKGLDGIRIQDKPHVIAKLLAEGRGGNGDGVVNSCKIHWDKRRDTFHFLYVYELPPAAPDPDPRFENKRIVATDAGAKHFQTWYSPTSGADGELMVDGRSDLEAQCRKIDRLHSKVVLFREEHEHPLPDRTRTSRQRGRRLKRLKKQEFRERARLRGWMKAGHYASANALLKEHDLVIAPHLRVEKMVRRDGRVFGSKVARAMLTWSHGLFKERLHSAAYRYSGRTVLTDAYEPGTSRTCPECGFWHEHLGGADVFVCPRCNVSIERDLNGARNNFFAFFGRAHGMGWDRRVRTINQTGVTLNATDTSSSSV